MSKQRHVGGEPVIGSAGPVEIEGGPWPTDEEIEAWMDEAKDLDYAYSDRVFAGSVLAWERARDKLGRIAGPMRNDAMLRKARDAAGRPPIVIAYPGGAGTADMVRRARAAGCRVHFPHGGPTGSTTEEPSDAKAK